MGPNGGLKSPFQSNTMILNDKNRCGGGDEVPRTIICRSTIKSYLIDYKDIFCALNTSPDLLRPVAICYFVVGSVVGRIDQHGFSEISTKCSDCN